MIYLDSETCGFHGVPVLIQWVKDDDKEIQLHSIWTNPIIDTLKLIEYFCENDICGFNLAFDWFHICKIYNTLSLFPDWSEYPENQIEALAILEKQARSGPCLKPKSAIDLMLHARKGKYQSLMDRDEIRIKRVPKVIAEEVAEELEKRVAVDDIYFAKRKDKYAPKWSIFPNKDEAFRNIVLKFAPSGGLKNLALHALKVKEEDVLLFSDIEVGSNAKPNEVAHAPYALALGSPKDWKGTWPEKIRAHITHWGFNELARKYAIKDVEYTRALHKYFDSPVSGDTDSELACMIAAVRWRGFTIDVPGLIELRDKLKAKQCGYPTAPTQARRYIEEVLNDSEKLILQGSTKKVILEELVKWRNDDDSAEHPAAERAINVLDARKANDEIRTYDKLIMAGRFHASMTVIGTRSSRMSGRTTIDKSGKSKGGINPQGIKKAKWVRSKFPFADYPDILCGGDFNAFEVSLAEAAYNDPNLRAALKAGKKIHALFGMELFPGKTYEEIVASDGTKEDMYTKGKQGVFAMIYGGDENTLKNKLGVDLEVGQKAYQTFIKKYPKIGEARKKVFDMFCSMRQPKGIGTNVEWHEPSDYIESLLGFRRYFTLENAISKALFQLASTPPKSWKEFKTRIIRREKEQTVAGAARSALYGAAFQIQAANMRAAANHVIQSSGAQITKEVQRKIWDLQPCGVHTWVVAPLNVHDEILCVTNPGFTNQVEKVVKDTVEAYRSKVPLIGIKWHTGIKNWAEK